MDFGDEIKSLAARIPEQLANIETEEATKNAFVLPFIKALGYNVFDPTEVVPEFVADIGTKKGEKVDYAIMRDGKASMIFECKWCGANLDKEHASQLYRYFSVTDARVGVLTNGVIYRFYSDLEAPNKMDAKPFLEIDLLDIKEPNIKELKKFSKSSFNLKEMLDSASDLKYTKEIKSVFGEQLQSPSEDFVRFFTKQVYSGTFNKSAKEQFTEITKSALNQFISEKISSRLQSALDQETGAAARGQMSIFDQEAMEDAGKDEVRKKYTTTEEEKEGLLVVKAILREVIDVKRVAMRDRMDYCGILLDDHKLKPICRLWFNTKQKYLGIFDENRREERFPINDLNDIYGYAERLKTTVSFYDE